MPAKGTKRATAKGEGHAGDISDNISEDDSAGQALDALATRRELTPSMQASEQDDGRPQAPSDIFPAVFSTPSVVRQERNISPDLRLDKAPNLQEQYDLALQEHRYEDLSGIEQAMLVEQSDMQQRWDLAVKEKRWVDAARYRDIVKSQNAEDTTPAVHALQPSRIKIERDDWPTWARLERANLQWRIHGAIQEQRYEDISDLDDAVIAEHCHLQQQWELAEDEDRYDDCTRLSDAIHRHLDIYIAQSHHGQGQMTTPNRPHQQIKMQPGLQITHGPALVIPDAVIRATHRMMEVTAAPVQAKQENMDNAVPDKRCKRESLGLRSTHGPILAIPPDIVPAVRMMLEATAAPAAAQQDDVGKDDHDNMGQGETTGCDYDASDKMSNAADKLKAQFDDKDVRGGWKNFGQLPAWGDGAGEGGTWDPGPPHIICFLDLSHNFARYFFPDCTLVR